MTEYPGAIKNFTTKEDKVDLNEAAHINDMQDEIEAIQTELGVDVAGSATNLVTRLARCLANNGAMKQGTSFPGSPNEGDFFYRTDEDVMYIYNGSGWDAQGQSLSNLVFCFSLGGDYTVDSYGVVLDDSLTPPASAIKKISWSVNGSTYRSIIRSKYKKLAGVNTITVYAHAWSSSVNSTVQIDIGGGTATGDSGAIAGTTPAWFSSFTVDVSGLSDGTVYELEVNLKSGDRGYLDSIIGIAS